MGKWKIGINGRKELYITKIKDVPVNMHLFLKRYWSRNLENYSDNELNI